jgi:type IV secretion system protein VirB10
VNAERQEPQGITGSSGAADPELQSGAPGGASDAPPQEDIVSVNSKKSGAGGNRAAKAAFFLVVGVLVVGLVVFLGGNKLSEWKKSLKASGKGKEAEQVSAFNPEGTGKKSNAPALGAAAPEAPRRPGEPAPGAATADVGAVRPMMKDGQPMLNEKGEALGVDSAGQVVTVPAIKLAGTGAPELPNAGGTPKRTAGQAAGAGSNTQQPPSRYGGSFLSTGSQQGTAGGGGTQDQGAGGGTPGRQGAMSPGQQNALDVLRQIAAGQSGKGDAGNAGGFAGPAAQPAPPPNPDSIGAQLNQSATPVALARRMADQDLVLPKGRQIDCVLTGRIVNELAGFTSCALTQNLYSDNGRVLLLERGSEAIGEYGTGGPNGSRRLFVVWNRVKTPAGVEIDLMSPGADALGTSGHPGFLEQRWLERIGTALLISVMKDAVALEAAKKAPATANSQNAPWSQTSSTGQSLAEQILKQTINVRPTLFINEGERISIYVARDLDFAPVYRLRLASTKGTSQ